MSTPILPYAMWESGTNQNSVPANDNSLRNQILNGFVISDSTTAEPALVSPGDDGKIYIIPAAATGTQWATFDEFDLAIFYGGTWYAFAPVEGIRVNLAGSLITWNGSAYVAIGGSDGGASIGVQYEADTGSTADSDPGPGLLKWNNATQASATVLFLDDNTTDGASLTGWWSALEAGGFCYLQHATDQDTWQIWEITSVTDASGYVKLAVSLIANGGSFADGDPMLVTLQQGITSGSAAWGSITGTLPSQTDLQAALDAKANDRSTVTAVTPSAGTATFDYALGDYFSLAPTANVTTLAFSNLPGSGRGASLMIHFTQDSTPRTITWPASFKWAGGSAGAVSTASGAIDVIAISTFDNGTTWNATIAKAFS